MPAREVERERTVEGEVLRYYQEKAIDDDWFDIWIDLAVLPAVRAHKKILQRLEWRRLDARGRRRVGMMEA